MLGNFLVIIRKERTALISVMHDLLAKELLGAGEEPGEAGYAHITVRTAVDEPFMKPDLVCRKLLFALLTFCHYASTTFARKRRQECAGVLSKRIVPLNVLTVSPVQRS